MANFVLTGRLLNGQPWLVNTATGTTVTPVITLATIIAPAPNQAFNVTGGYANFIPTGLQYSIDSTNGVNGTWVNAVSPTILSGAFSFAVSGGLPVGTYTIWVRATNNTAVYDDSNPFAIQQPLSATLAVDVITAPALNTNFQVTGTYANFHLTGLQYSTNSTNGTDGTFGATTNLVNTSNTWGFTAAPLSAGTYKIWVRRSDDFSLVAASNTFIVQPGGSTAAITQTVPLDSYRVFARDAYIGNPTGFTTTFNKGWGAVNLQINPSASGTLFAALYDAQSSGANTNPATGTRIQAPTGLQSVAQGNQTVVLNLPAAAKWYYVDLALNANMTNALRISTPLGVGAVIGYTGTSHTGAFLSPFAYGFDQNAGTPGPWTKSFPDIHTYPETFSPYGVGWQPSNGAYVNLPVYNANVWAPPGDLESPYVTTFAPEFLSRCVSQLGVVAALIGLGTGGGHMKDFDPDRAANPGDYRALFPYILPFLDKTKDANGKWKLDGFISLMAMNDKDYNIGRSLTGKRLKKFVDAVNAGCARQPVWIFEADPSGPQIWDTTGGVPYRQATQDVATAIGGAAAGAYVMPYNTWGFYQSSHSTMVSRMWMARDFYRSLMVAMGPAKGGFTGWGPKVTSATRTGTAITLTVTHDGGTALSAWRYGESGTAPYLVEVTSGIPNTDLVGTVQVFPAGKAYASNANTTLALAASNPVQIINGTTIQVNLAADPGNTTGLDIYTAAAFDNQPNRMTMIVDDHADADGLRGRGVNYAFTPLYVPPPSQPSQAITVNAPLPTAVGAWMLLKGGGAGAPLAGAGTGLPASSIEVSIGAGAYVVPDSLIIKNDNSWSCFVRTPGTIASGVTVNVRRAGQGSPDASTTVNLVAARDTLPSSIKASAVAFYDSTNYGTMFQDSAATVPLADLKPIGCWKDALGTSSNNALNNGSNPSMSLPYFTQRVRSGNQQNAFPASYDDPSLDRPSVVFEYANAGNGASTGLQALTPALGSAIAGDFTVFLSGHIEPFDGYFFQLGSSNGARVAMDSNLNIRSEFLRSGPNNNPLTTEISTGAANTELRDEYIGRYNSSTGIMTLDRTASIGFPGFTQTVGPISDLTAVSNLGALYIGTNDVNHGSTMRMVALLFFNRRLTDSEVIDLQTWSAARYVAQ